MFPSFFDVQETNENECEVFIALILPLCLTLSPI